MPDGLCLNPNCQHPDDSHDVHLGICLVEGCSCLAYRSEAEDLETQIGSGEIPDELDFD